ncbi:MAG: response regulator [Desulfobacterales bacterium]|nr:response regulator [Desulfobacterales bacterium]
MTLRSEKERYPILIVDDEPELVEALVNYLDEYNVDYAHDADSALKKIDSGKFKIVMTDIVMAGVDGIELLRRIKSRNPGIQVIMMTGQTTVMRASEALQDGALKYLLKPFDDIGEVDRAIDEAIKKAKEWEDVFRRTIQAGKRKGDTASQPNTASPVDGKEFGFVDGTQPGDQDGRARRDIGEPIVDRAIMDAFMMEFREDIEEAIKYVLMLEKNPGDTESLHALFRKMHNMKGNAGVLGLEKIAGVSHETETLLDSIRDGTIEINSEIIETLLANCDALAGLVDEVEGKPRDS